MALSLGRRLYNLTGRREAGDDAAYPPRPAGRLVWLHAPRVEVVQGLLHLAAKLAQEDGVQTVLTGPRETGHLPPPADQPDEAKAFLDHWRPDAIVLADGEIRTALLFEAEARGIPVMVVEGREPYLARGRDGWFPGLLRGAVQTVRHVLALDETAGRAYRRAGAAQVEVVGRMEHLSAALSCNEGERAVLAEILKARPVWLATAVPEAEEAAVIAAHRAALRLSHRLLLILVPENQARTEELARRIEEGEGWVVARRAVDEEPDPETAVYLPDSAEEYGLWYRLAPVAFVGGSLYGAGALRDPLEAAALGSAIIHGPRPGPYGPIFGRLGAARAARAVSSADDLGEALSDLLAPDRAALAAQSAWAVASDGADVTEKVLRYLRLYVGER
ncbi:MAG: 3-deoxy-D-manno-octulosonic acid transferase [Rhodobacteraceae bacterium]|nr:3-deoxy-D-manno-octulosonic acid transferase [Paracoccaceae bacterium]